MVEKNVRQEIHCRICRSRRLTQFLDLGEQPLANAFLDKPSLENSDEPKYPLRVLLCRSCGLCQLRDIVNPEILFRNYLYFSSGMPTSSHFQNYAAEVVNNFISCPGESVVEIGSNDGHLLRRIKDLGVNVLGIDPALNIAQIARERGVETIADFFSTDLAVKIRKWWGAPEVIIANNVVAHIDDLHNLLYGVRLLLALDGVFIFEAPYLGDMFENLSFDTIYHEHLSYLSLKPLINLLEQYGMEIFDVKLFPVQGNSIRVYASSKGTRMRSHSVEEFLAKESALKMKEMETYVVFAERIAKLKEGVANLLRYLKSQGKKIAGYGAPAKGNTFLNYFGIGSDILDYVTEELPSKIGLYTPGSHIPVVDIAWARENPPDYFFLLAWNYKNAILKKEVEFISRGGKFIMPVGNVRIL